MIITFKEKVEVDAAEYNLLAESNFPERILILVLHIPFCSCWRGAVVK
jgi:hypothetical protein